MVIEVQEPNDEQTSEVGWLLRSLGGESRCGSNGHMSPGVFTRLASFSGSADVSTPNSSHKNLDLLGPPLDRDFLRISFLDWFVLHESLGFQASSSSFAVISRTKSQFSHVNYP